MNFLVNRPPPRTVRGPVNRQQRRQSKHKNPHLASRALFEDELRRALRKQGVQLVTCSTGEQGDEPRWVLEVRRGDTRLFMQSPPKTVDGMVKQILAKLNGEPEIALPATATVQDLFEPSKDSTVVTKDGTYSTVTIPKKVEPAVESYEDLSHYLGEK